VGTLNALYSQMDMAKDKEDAPFRLGPALLDALETVPRNLAGLGAALANPLRAAAGTPAGLEQPEEESGLFRALRSRFSEGPAQAYAYLLFVLIYVPCIVAVSAMAREIGPLLAVLSVLYLTLLGWIVSTLFYQLAVGRQPLWILISVALFGAIGGVLYLLGRGRRNATPSTS
jgi:ferrous iron transport protein B